MYPRYSTSLSVAGGGAWLDDARRADRPVILPLRHDICARFVSEQPPVWLLPHTPLHTGEGNECGEDNECGVGIGTFDGHMGGSLPLPPSPYDSLRYDSSV